VVGDDKPLAWGQDMIHMNKCTLRVGDSMECADMRLEGEHKCMDMEVEGSGPWQQQVWVVVVQELKGPKTWALEQVAVMRALS